MTMRAALIFMATAFASAGAFAQDSAPSEPPAADAKALAESCSARKFETTIRVKSGDKVRGQKVTLCGKEGQSDADWARTLRDAADKILASEKMPKESKDQIVAALTAEIVKLEAPKAAAPAAPAPAPGAGTSLLAIGPLPAKPAERPPVPALAGSSDKPAEYSALPPLPAPKPLAATAAVAASASLPLLRKPALTIDCYVLGEPGSESECVMIERETRLAIRADENVPAGTSLRFLRRGDFKGEVALGPMRKGRTARVRLPDDVCSGVVGSVVTIEIVGRPPKGGADQVLDSLGPYELRC